MEMELVLLVILAGLMGVSGAVGGATLASFAPTSPRLLAAMLGCNTAVAMLSGLAAQANSPCEPTFYGFATFMILILVTVTCFGGAYLAMATFLTYFKK